MNPSERAERRENAAFLIFAILLFGLFAGAYAVTLTETKAPPIVLKAGWLIDAHDVNRFHDPSRK